MYHESVPDSSRGRTQPPVIALEPDAEIVVRRRVDEVPRELIGLVTSTSPPHEFHRGVQLPTTPATADQALEFVRAATLIEHELRRALNRAQFDWAIQSVLLGTQLKDVANAAGVTPSAISRRWPTLGSMRSTHEWFRDATNADAWAKACVALREIAAELRAAQQSWAAEDSVSLTPVVARLARVAREYEHARARQFDAPLVTLPERYELVSRSPGMVEILTNPRLIEAVTPMAHMTLDHLRAEWRAYRMGAAVDHQGQPRV